MSSKLLYILQILLLNTIFINASTFQCVDCNGDGKGDCTDKRVTDGCVIDSKSGYSCGQYTYNRRSLRFSDWSIPEALRFSDWSIPEATDDLDQCIPDDLNITETNVEICCVWSRILGCQILVKPGNEFTCGICRTFNKRQTNLYTGLSPCPCSRGSPILHNHVVYGIPVAMQFVFKLSWNFIIWILDFKFGYRLNIM